MSFDSSKPDLYEQVTQALIAALEEGAGEYRMPWHSLSQPTNATSHKAYRGINTLLLWAAAQKHSYHSSEWATYRQWLELGGQVRKGERSTLIVFWKFFDSRSETEETPEEDGEASTGKSARCMARAYHVFNAAQVDGMPAKSHEECRSPNGSHTLSISLPRFPAPSYMKAIAPITRPQTIAFTCRRFHSSNQAPRFTVLLPTKEPTGPARKAA